MKNLEFRAVGVYGGPILTGFHRERDPQTGRNQMVHESTTSTGVHIRQLLDDNLQPQRAILSGGITGQASSLVVGVGGRIGFSTRNDGVTDAWSIRDATSDVARVEVSTKRDGRVDRWEQYVKGALVRVDLDTDRNGKADRWMIYEDGILMDTFMDANEDGQPDGLSPR